MADEYGAEFDTEGDVLGTALEELAKHIEPLGSNAKFLTSLSYLLLLWASFEVYQLEPFVPLNEDEEGGEGGAKIISLANGWKIFDFRESPLAETDETSRFRSWRLHWRFLEPVL
jgi:hypothetical protein